VIEYNYELFDNAKKDLNNAVTSLSLLTSLKDKFQSCDVPEIVNGISVYNIWTKCDDIINSKDDLKANFDCLETAIKETGYAEQRYLDAMEELEEVKDEIWDFSTTPTSGRPTIEDVERMRQEIADLNERKGKLEEETKYLKDLLGITTEEDKTWYESFAESMDAWYADQVKLTDSYRNIFTNKTSGGLISNIGDYFETLTEVNKNQKSTKQQVESDFYRGIGNVAEKIGDFAIQVVGWLSATANKNPIGHMSPYQMYMDENGLLDTQVNMIENATKSAITKNVVDDWYTSYYKETEKGKDINEHSYIKYDSEYAEAISKTTESVGETAAILALSTVGGPATGALLAASFEGTVKGGEAADYAYDNGATMDEAMLYSGMVGTVYAGATYIGSNYFSNIIGKTGSFMPTFTTTDAIKAAFSSSAVTRSFLNAMAAGAIPVTESVAEWLTWGSENHVLNRYLVNYNDLNDPDLREIFIKNSVGQNALFAATTGFGLSTVGEVMGSLQQGKVFRETVMRDYGLSPTEVDDLIDRIHYVNGLEYVATQGSGSAGLHYGGPGGGDMYIKLSPFATPAYDKNTVYHESMHDLGELRLYNSNALNETTTELLTSRLAGLKPMAYNPKATVLLDKIEETIDPTKSILKDLYSVSRNYVPTEKNVFGIPKGLSEYQIDKLVTQIAKVTGNEDIAFPYIEDITKALEKAVYGDANTKIIGENELQAILDELTLWRAYD
jgi:hypothetical protein